MLTENTVTKLQEMKLTAMARAFKEQLTDPNINGLAFEDRFCLLVDQEWTSRINNHLKACFLQLHCRKAQHTVTRGYRQR